jgi:hypothetical protein
MLISGAFRPFLRLSPMISRGMELRGSTTAGPSDRFNTPEGRKGLDLECAPSAMLLIPLQNILLSSWRVFSRRALSLFAEIALHFTPKAYPAGFPKLRLLALENSSPL